MKTSPDNYEPDNNAPAVLDEAPAFFSLENLKVAQVQVVGGMLNGFSIGFVAVYATLYEFSTNCSLYKSSDVCNTVMNDKCKWDTTKKECGWVKINCGWTHTTEAACTSTDDCVWSYSDNTCTNPIGYSKLYSGVFACAMIVGSMLGSIYAGQVVSKVGHKTSFLVIGIVGVVSSVMYHVATATEEFWVLCAGRLLIGVVLGVVCVACPMYVDQNAHPKHSKVNGVLFQVFITLGIALAATMGLALGNSVNYEKDTRIIARMQGFCSFSLLLSVLMVVLGIVLGESKRKFATGEQESGTDVLDPNEYGYGQMLGRLVMGAVTAGTLQLTGINAVMNYAPTIMSSLGMNALLGNFVVMLWNFLATLFAVPLASFFTMRQLFLVNSFVASASCLLLCGIPVFPGVASTDVKNGVAITGIIVFIGAFEIGIGPCFFVLAQDLFPPSFRPKGSSFVVMSQFIFNIIINLGYPIATQAISGGPSGNQDKGQAVAFIVFGCVGLLCFLLQLFFLFPWEESSRRAAPAEHNAPTAVGASDDNKAA